MFDIGASELLLIVIVAVVVIGPKDLPRAMRLAGKWIAKMRRISGHFRSGIETMIREAELEEMEQKWREQNEAIMKAHPAAVSADAALPAPASAEAAVASPATAPAPAPVTPPVTAAVAAADSYDPPAERHEQPEAHLPAPPP